MRAISVMCVLALSAARVAAQTAEQAPDGPERDVVMSSAGGISKGSYQAGVDWAISEFLRRQRGESMRKGVSPVLTMARLPEALPRFDLRATTGASAGNINALFAAVGWCIDTIDGRAEIRAEDSLFWKTWVNTGIADLLPKQRNVEASALSRVFMERQHKQTLRDVLARAVPVENCNVRVGVTLTRVQPETVTIDDTAGAIGVIGVQRFAGVFDVVGRDRRSDAERGAAGPTAAGAQSWVDFAWNEAAAKRQSYGALALPPRLRDQSMERREERLSDVFDYMVASSAFPVAFAPKQLCYEGGGLLLPKPGDAVRCDQFSDGGVFDNNPIGLAVRLLETQREALGPLELLKPIDVAYSSPGNFRGPMRLARRRVDELSVRTGLGAAAQLFSGAMASARDYELQSLRRQTQRDTELGKVKSGPEHEVGPRTAAPVLRVSSRRAPILGESLSSFGAFLGRPLREYDFYSGVYDGLEFIARQFICAQLEDKPALDTCVSKVHARLVVDDVMTMTPVAKEVMRWHIDAEYSPPLAGRSTGPAACEANGADRIDSEADKARVAIMCVIHEAVSRDPGDEGCEDRNSGIVEGLLCPGGLGRVLHALGKERKPEPGKRYRMAVKEAIGVLLPPCLTDQEKAKVEGRPSLISQGECAVDQAFSDLVDAPEREVYTLMRRALRNIEAGEIEARTKGSSSVDFLAKVAFSIFRSSTMRYRNGNLGPLEFNRSSSALGGGNVRSVFATALGIAAPNYVHNVVLNDRPDQSALGWQPVSVILSSRLYLNSQAELYLPGLGWDKMWSSGIGEHVGWGASVGSFSLFPRRAFLPGAIDVGYFRLPESFGTESENKGRHTLRVSTRHVSDKLMLTALWAPNRFQLSFGVSDLNGMLYWVLR